MSPTILDAGPLVAYLDKRDQHHAWSVAEFRNLTVPLITCEPVLTEACFLLKDLPAAISRIQFWLSRGIIRVAFSLAVQHDRVFALMEKYRSVPMSLADACLVCMAENAGDSRVFTADTDFGIYRLNRRRIVLRISPTE